VKVFNNLSHQLEEFEPIKAGEVTIYSCGPTVYDHSHIGHARSAITWDLLYRYLKHRGYKVRWARNITNVDDKIVKRAAELAMSPDQLSRQFTYEFWSDMVALNLSWPDYEPRATDYIPAMIQYIKDLIQQGYAYEVEGDVYFRVTKHHDYGQLKGLSPDKLREGISRVEYNNKKEDQLDFALWKSFPDEEAFDSPWGKGRPGWHLECSTMIAEIFGEDGSADTIIDIHAGGDDLIFPHHENECAQSECHSDKHLAKYWMHNGMVMINGAKMSKSENNFFTIKDVLAKYKANTIRYFCLSTHYKKQINFTDEALAAAEAGFSKLLKVSKGAKGEIDQTLVNEFNNIMDKDLSSPQALALLFDASKDENKAATIAYLLEVLGFNLQESSVDEGGSSKALAAAMSILLELRDKARANKDFATSDMIRDSLAASGIIIKDYRNKPTEWSLA